MSNFTVFDIVGQDAGKLLEYLAVDKLGPVGKGIYTHFIDRFGGIHSDLTIVHMDENVYRVISGCSTGPRDAFWINNTRGDKHFRAQLVDRTDELATLAVWGPKARAVLRSLVDDPDQLDDERFPFGSAQHIRIRGIPVWAFRISYVGELGWELYVPFSYGLTLWDILFEKGVVPVGMETVANSRRLEKGFCLQNIDLSTAYTLCEAGLARRRIKERDFLGKEALTTQRARASQAAYLCIMTMVNNVDAQGVRRYPVGGQWPILDRNGDVLVDELGRRSYVTSVEYGPSVDKVICLGYIPAAHAVEGGTVTMEYFNEVYSLHIESVGCRPLYDPSNSRVRSKS